MKQATVIVTGASQGIGVGAAKAFLTRGYNVVANSRKISQSRAYAPSNRLALVDGDIGDIATARKIAETAVEKFGSIDALVNNAGIYFTKPFTEYTAEDFRKLTATNLDGFIYISQLAVKQMLKQGTGGSIVSISASLADHPIAGDTASLPMMTKGGINSISKSLAMEYSKAGIRVNTVAPGVVATPLHDDISPDFIRARSPMGRVSSVQDIVDAIIYLTEAKTVTGEVLHVDGGAHVGKW